jgi:hypothetical protein
MQKIEYAYEKSLIGGGIPVVAGQAGKCIKVKENASIITP